MCVCTHVYIVLTNLQYLHTYPLDSQRSVAITYAFVYNCSTATVLYGDEMASNGRPSTFDNNHESLQSDDRSTHHGPDLGRAVTDAVHERFRQNFVYCDNCKEKFIGNGVSIQKHFNKSHPADVYCIYCPGKVFHYYRVKDDNDKAEKIYYHRCRDWYTK